MQDLEAKILASKNKEVGPSKVDGVPFCPILATSLLSAEPAQPRHWQGNNMGFS